jgi:Transglycosylase SLT domain
VRSYACTDALDAERSSASVTAAPAVALVAAAIATVVLTALFATLAVGTLAGVSGVSGVSGGAASLTGGGMAGIPPRYLGLYLKAARRYGLDWAVLAAIGKVECDHGRAPDPSCKQEGAVNPAGAGGPTQFLAATWRQYGVDGDGDGEADRWDPADAVFAMANYLRAAGAPFDYKRAIFAYNHASWYVAKVEGWAARYRRAAARAPAGGSTGESALASTPGRDLPDEGGALDVVRFVAGSRAVLSPVDGHLALVPSEAPEPVQAMVIAGNEIQDLPYGPAGHPDPRGASSEDCSSTVSYVLYRSGVRSISEIVRDNPLAQDYVRWGEPGPGRWVTIYATSAPTDHVFVVIAGLRLDTSHDGTDVGPNRREDGPRWRVLDHIPTWAHWTLRHPPGL